MSPHPGASAGFSRCRGPVLCGCAAAARLPRAQRAPVPPHACRALRVPRARPGGKTEKAPSALSLNAVQASVRRRAEPGHEARPLCRRSVLSHSGCGAGKAAVRQRRAGRERDRNAASPGSESRRPAGRNGMGLSGGSAGPASLGPASSALLARSRGLYKSVQVPLAESSYAGSG